MGRRQDHLCGIFCFTYKVLNHDDSILSKQSTTPLRLTFVKMGGQALRYQAPVPRNQFPGWIQETDSLYFYD